jgi:hypothetical protein
VSNIDIVLKISSLQTQISKLIKIGGSKHLRSCAPHADRVFPHSKKRIISDTRNLGLSLRSTGPWWPPSGPDHIIGRCYASRRLCNFLKWAHAESKKWPKNRRQHEEVISNCRKVNELLDLVEELRAFLAPEKMLRDRSPAGS